MGEPAGPEGNNGRGRLWPLTLLRRALAAVHKPLRPLKRIPAIAGRRQKKAKRQLPLASMTLGPIVMEDPGARYAKGDEISWIKDLTKPCLPAHALPPAALFCAPMRLPLPPVQHAQLNQRGAQLNHHHLGQQLGRGRVSPSVPAAMQLLHTAQALLCSPSRST